MNGLYVAETITDKHMNNPYSDTLWVCYNAPYKLCKRCPLYHGLKGSCCEPISKAVSKLQQPRYSLYVNLDEVIDRDKLPSKGCRWSGFFNLKPVLSIREKEILS